MDFEITRTSDADALSAVARATFLQTFAHMIPWRSLAARARTQDSPGAFRDHLDRGDAAWLARVRSTQAPIGFALLTAPRLPEVETQASDLELKRIYLLDRFHGHGLGHRLHDAVEVEARERGASRLLLGVYHENPTLNWYARQGYREIGSRAFTVGEDTFHDLILAKAL